MKRERARDPRVDAAWRAASREEPPRGARRRDPRRGAARGRRRSASAATRPRTGGPLAAAATLRSIAVGIVADHAARAGGSDGRSGDRRRDGTGEAGDCDLPARGAGCGRARRRSKEATSPRSRRPRRAFAPKPAPSQPSVDALDKPARVNERSPEADGVRPPARRGIAPSDTGLRRRRSEAFPAAAPSCDRRPPRCCGRGAECDAGVCGGERAGALCGGRAQDRAAPSPPRPAALAEKPRAKRRPRSRRSRDAGADEAESRAQRRGLDHADPPLARRGQDRRSREGARRVSRRATAIAPTPCFPPDLRESSSPAGAGAR